MKKLHLLLFFFFSAMISYSQSGTIPYQAVARDTSGALIQNESVFVQFNIRDNTPTGPYLYIEAFTVTTNEYGLINVNIGAGTPLFGSFNSIQWGSGSEKYMDIYLAHNGPYVLMGTVPFSSVPLAFHANTAGTVSGTASGDVNGAYNNLQITGNAVGTAELADNSVSGSKIAMGADNIGDLMYYNGADYVRLPAGISGQVLTMSGNTPSWQTMTGQLVASNTVSGSAIAPTATNAFLSGTPIVSITSTTQKVYVVSTCALGALTNPATSLNIYAGYKVSSATAPSTFGGGIFGLSCPANNRLTYTISAVITNLPPGTYQFGMVGNSSNAANWINNEWSYTSVMVYN
jgi:hypothetical protein